MQTAGKIECSSFIWFEAQCCVQECELINVVLVCCSIVCCGVSMKSTTWQLIVHYKSNLTYNLQLFCWLDFQNQITIVWTILTMRTNGFSIIYITYMIYNSKYVYYGTYAIIWTGASWNPSCSKVGNCRLIMMVMVCGPHEISQVFYIALHYDYKYRKIVRENIGAAVCQDVNCVGSKSIWSFHLERFSILSFD